MAKAIPVTYDGDERRAHQLLARYSAARARGARGTGAKAGDLVTLLLKKRLFSSPAAFAATLDVHVQTLAKPSAGRGRTGRLEIEGTNQPDLGWLDDIDEMADAEEGPDGQDLAERELLDRAASFLDEPDDDEGELLAELQRWCQRHAEPADSKAKALVAELKGICRPKGQWNDERVVVFTGGNGPLNLQVAAELAAAGVLVVAVAEAASLFRLPNAPHVARMSAAAPRYSLQGFSYLRTLARWRVPVLSRAAVVEVIGDGRAEVATVARLDATGRPLSAGARRFEVDAVCLGLGFVPSSELARSLGCEHRVDERSGALVVERDRNGRTSIEGIWVAGEGGGIGGAQVAQAMGTLAGIDAASFVGRPLDKELVLAIRSKIAAPSSRSLTIVTSPLSSSGRSKATTMRGSTKAGSRPRAKKQPVTQLCAYSMLPKVRTRRLNPVRYSRSAEGDKNTRSTPRASIRRSSCSRRSRWSGILSLLCAITK